MKILTAMGNPILNEKLCKLCGNSIIGKDIQYKDGILEILEEKSNIDCLIISNTLPGEINFNNLINEIKNINPEIEIYVFLEEKDSNIENYLISKSIYKIYYLNETNFDEFIKAFDENKKDIIVGISQEINEFKKLIMNENKINNYGENIEKEVFSNTELSENNKNQEINYIKKDNNFYSEDDENCNIVAISGNFGVGKSLISSILSKIISNIGKKTLLIDFDIENSSINTIFGCKKYRENQKYVEDLIYKVDDNLDIMCGIDKLINFKENLNKLLIKEIIERLKENYEFIIIDVSSRIELKYVKLVLTCCEKIIFLIEPNILEINKSNNILEVFINDFNIDVDKIKIVFNKVNKYKIAESVLEEIFSEFEIIENIEYEEKYNLFINKNTNINLEKIDLEKIYRNIIKEEEIYANSSVRNY